MAWGRSGWGVRGRRSSPATEPIAAETDRELLGLCVLCSGSLPRLSVSASPSFSEAQGLSHGLVKVDAEKGKWGWLPSCPRLFQDLV